MKRYIKSDTAKVIPNYEWIFTFVYEVSDSVEIAVADLFKDKKLIKHREPGTNVPQLSTEQLAMYDDWMHTILNIIAYNGFTISDYHQSGETYSYYITVNSEIGDLITGTVINVIFRIANHRKSNWVETVSKDGTLNAPHTVLINDDEYSDGTRVVREVNRICKEILSGDYSSVLPLK